MSAGVVEKTFAGRTALISGGSSGIGLATARLLASHGASVAVVGRSAERAEAAARELAEASGAEVLAVPGDVRDWADCDRIVATVHDQWGRIDVLANCVGSAPGGMLGSIALEQWTDAFNGKVFGSVALMRAVVPIMAGHGYGRIVNVAGTAGEEPEPWMAVAGATNAALITITKALSREVASQGITVNAVCPGPTRTSRWEGLVKSYSAMRALSLEEGERELLAGIPAGRPAEASEVATLIAFLASEGAGHITGTSTTIDGGARRGIS